MHQDLVVHACVKGRDDHRESLLDHGGMADGRGVQQRVDALLGVGAVPLVPPQPVGRLRTQSLLADAVLSCRLFDWTGVARVPAGTRVGRLC